MVRRGSICRALPLALAVALVAPPLLASHALPIFESVSRGYLTTEDGDLMPRRTTLRQVVGSTMFQGLNSVVLAIECELFLDDDFAPSLQPRIPAMDQLGKVVAVVYRVGENGSRERLAKVKTRHQASGELFGYRLVGIPGGLREGDLLEWEVKLKGFSAFLADREIELLAGVGHPGLLDD